MSAEPFIDPEVVRRLSDSPTSDCAVIITCSARDVPTADPKPPVVGAKPLADLPGIFAAEIDARALKELCKTGNVAAIELDCEEHMLDRPRAQ